MEDRGSLPRTSVLAALCFLASLGSSVCLAMASFARASLERGPGSGMFETHSMPPMNQVLGGAAIGFAAMALALWLSARAAIAEEKGEVCGRGLYRTGVWISIASIVLSALFL
ncbi:MAG: hypothetical protein HY716_00675 [Planctomycetes bacterium]|nr:hypothetical protein [Planctomycetota bacterium]